MRIQSKSVLAAFVYLSCSTMIQAEQPHQTFTVHGRLSPYNGDISCVIWIVGTKRRLGVHESGNEEPELPEALDALLFAHGREREIYADFVVEPVTPYQEGVRQMVRVISASNLVVVENGEIVLRKKTLP